jgi:LacI family transcriptional regulator, galactose operon repressor
VRRRSAGGVGCSAAIRACRREGEGAREGWGAAGALSSYEAAGPSRADGEVAARVALGARPRSTTLLFPTDRLAWGALDAARRSGIDVPRELSVAGIDDCRDQSPHPGV